MPKSCAVLGATCGRTDDGCGGEIHCGSCASGAVCSPQNQCEPAPKAGGATEWAVKRPDPIVSISADADGRVFTLAAPQSAGAVFEGLNAQAAPLFALIRDDELSVVRAARSADVLIVSGKSQGYSGGSLVQSFAKNGALQTNLAGASDMTPLTALAAHSSGAVAWLHSSSTDDAIVLRSPSGAVTTVVMTGKPIRITDAAYDDAGNLIIATDLVGAFEWDGRAFGQAGQQRAAVFKLSSAGALLWGQELPAPSRARSVGTTAIGTVVLAVQQTASISFAGTTLPPGNALYVYEAAGTPRFGRAVMHGSTLRMAVDPVGRAFVMAGAEGCAGVTVQKWNLAGAREWDRTVPGVCSAVTGIAVAGRAPVLGGAFEGTVDFGTGTPLSAGANRAGFILRLSP